MKFIFLIIKLLIGLFIGISIGIAIILVISKQSLPYNHWLYQTFGIKKPKIVGFLPYWLADKATGPYSNLLTTYTYFGLTIDVNGEIIKLDNPQEQAQGWTMLTSEKLANKFRDDPVTDKSLLVSLMDEEKIIQLLQEPEKNAQNLIRDISPIMKKYGYSDLNIDIESFSETEESTRSAFTKFLSMVKEGMQVENLGTVTIDLTPISLVKKHLIDPVAIGEVADTIVLMAYDYNYSGSEISGPVAPVNGVDTIREYDVETAIQLALKVIPKQKLILGIPLYGYQYDTLSDSPISPVVPGSGQTVSNRRAEDLLNHCSDCKQIDDPIAKSPFLIRPNQGVYEHYAYEDEKSFSEKIALAKKYDLGGIAMWALGYEGNEMLTPLKEYKNTIRWVDEERFRNMKNTLFQLFHSI